jgi:hypothetical protein
MYSVMTWKARPLSPGQDKRMMDIWGKIEADMATNTNLERVCWFMYTDGSGGVTVTKSRDVDGALAFEAEVAMALTEFLEIETKAALDLDSAMPAILKAVERTNA